MKKHKRKEGLKHDTREIQRDVFKRPKTKSLLNDPLKLNSEFRRPETFNEIRRLVKNGIKKDISRPFKRKREADEFSSRGFKVGTANFWREQRNDQRFDRRRRVCNSRAKRRAVLFGLGRAGSGRGGPKDRRLTEDSKIKC